MVGCPYPIDFLVGKGAFYGVLVKGGVFVQDGGEGGPEAVHGGFGVVAYAVQAEEHGIA